MSITRKLGAAVAATALSVGAATASAGAAGAINRVGCSNYNYLWIYSNQTTCWANAGGISVALYSTTGLSSGNNAGFVRFTSGATRNFAKYSTASWSTSTVNYVAIY